jgi:GNAT superfamily N-acetyltransferase
VIRRAGTDDAPAIARIFLESRAEAMSWLPVLHAPEDVFGHFRGRLDTDEVYVFEREGEVAGFALLNGDELDAFYVAPEQQRRGVGAALFGTSRSSAPSGSASGCSATTPARGASTSPTARGSCTGPTA